MKPQSKITQILSTHSPSGAFVLITLCEDGSIWDYYKENWSCILEAPTPPKSDLPVMGKSYRSKYDSDIISTPVRIEQVTKERVIFAECDDSLDLDLFFDCYEPIPQEPKGGANDK